MSLKTWNATAAGVIVVGMVAAGIWHSLPTRAEIDAYHLNVVRAQEQLTMAEMAQRKAEGERLIDWCHGRGGTAHTNASGVFSGCTIPAK